DSAIQLAAERELSRAVTSSRASAGWVAVVDVQSGAVLALASNPAFDANEPGRDPAVWRHRAVQDQLEPGSTIKSFVVAAALDAGAIDPAKPLYCENGVWERHGHRIHDTHKVTWATPPAVLRESSNICAAKIGEALGKQRLTAALRAFGFGERSGVGLPGEARGRARDRRDARGSGREGNRDEGAGERVPRRRQDGDRAEGGPGAGRLRREAAG